MSHANNLPKVCRCGIFIALRDKQAKNISKSVDLQRKFSLFFEDISHDASGKAPVGLCRTCYLALYDLSHGKALSVNSRSATQFDFGLDINSLPKTRNAIDCVGNCVVCKIVREHIGTPVRQLGLKAPKVGRKRSQENKNVSLSVTSSCKKCFKRLSASEVSNTAKHICVSKTTSVRFVTSQLMDTGLQEYVLSSSLKDAETLSAPFVDTVTVKTFGRPRQLNFSASKSGSSTSKVSLGFKELIGLKSLSNTFSNNMLSNVKKVLGPNVVLPSMTKFRDDKNASLGHLFGVIDLQLETIVDGKKQIGTHSVIYCTDMNKLLKDWSGETFDKETKLICKLSCDHGQQYLKVALQIINEPKWSNSVDDFLIVVAAEVPETHLNLGMIFSLEPLQNFIHHGNHVLFITGDLKCMQLLQGKQLIIVDLTAI